MRENKRFTSHCPQYNELRHPQHLTAQLREGIALGIMLYQIAKKAAKCAIPSSKTG